MTKPGLMRRLLLAFGLGQKRPWGQSWRDRQRTRAVYLSVTEMQDPTRLARVYEIRKDEPLYPGRGS